MDRDLNGRLEALESELRILRDRQQIHDALMLYCRGTDRCDPDLVRSTFPSFEAERTINTLRSTTKTMMHFVGNMLIDVDGDRASSESYFVAYHQLEHEGTEFTRTMTGRYFHRWERQEGRWVTVDRTTRVDWSRLDEVLNRAPEGASWPLSWEPRRSTYVYGERSRDDLAYTWTREPAADP